MPHAALWVVQRRFGIGVKVHHPSFNAARGFVGGAARNRLRVSPCAARSFNAARGFVGGAASDLGLVSH